MCGDFSKLTPFNFEPLEFSSEDEYFSAEEGTEEVDSSSNKRLNDLNWCICNGGSIFCQELNEITEEKFEGTL